MNFYPRHLGDYAKDAGHLTMIEHGAYTLLLDRYYSIEGPIAADQAYRITHARSPEEREAVDTVLKEFFFLTSEGWRHTRCDLEIEKYRVKSSKAQLSANARWNKASPAIKSPDAVRSHSARNADAVLAINQEPLTNTKAPKASTRTNLETNPAEQACVLMREAGCPTTNPSHPDLLAALDEGVTPKELGDTAREAVETSKPKPFPWAIATARGRHRDGHTKIPTGAFPHASSRPISAVDRIAANVQRGQQADFEHSRHIEARPL